VTPAVKRNDKYLRKAIGEPGYKVFGLAWPVVAADWISGIAGRCPGLNTVTLSLKKPARSKGAGIRVVRGHAWKSAFPLYPLRFYENEKAAIWRSSFFAAIPRFFSCSNGGTSAILSGWAIRAPWFMLKEDVSRRGIHIGNKRADLGRSV